MAFCLERIIQKSQSRKNYFQSLLAIDCLGKEVTSYALDGYAEKAYDFASDLIRQLSADLKGIDDILSHRSKKSMAIHSAKTKTREKEHHKTEDLVYMSPVTADLVDTVLNVAKYDCNVIIQGETGVGKEKVLIFSTGTAREKESRASR